MRAEVANADICCVERRGRWSGAVLLACVVLTVGTQADAYCRTTTCNPEKEDCSPSAGQACTTKGLPLYWPVKCPSYALQRSASPGIITYDQFSLAARNAFGAWTSADCSGANPSIQVVDLGPITEAHTCYNKVNPNANQIYFQEKSWPHKDSSETLALTTVSFNPDTGEIYDVDIEINSAQNPITVSDNNRQYDLQSILTHEIGHFLGLAHSPQPPTATMWPKYESGSLELRTLDPDDVAGICAIYPANRKATACDPAPRHGFGTSCGDPAPESGCCSSAICPTRTSSTGAAGVAVALLLGLLRPLRRRRSD